MCVSECDRVASIMRKTLPTMGLLCHGKKKKRESHILQYRKFQVPEDEALPVNIGMHEEG